MKCNHETRQRLYAGLECPACLKEERDQLRKDLTVAEQQIDEISKLFHRWDDGHLTDPCFSSTMAALLHKPNDLRSAKPQEGITKVAEQQVGEFWEDAAKLVRDLATEFLDFDNPNDKLALDFAHIVQKKMRETHDLRKPLLMCVKCGYSGPISHPHPRHLGEGMCNYAAGPAPEVKCNCEEKDRKVAICAMHPFEIYVNGRKKPVGLRMSHEDAVRISGLTGADLYTVCYSIIGANRGGSLTPGQSVKVEAGMSIDVAFTGNA